MLFLMLPQDFVIVQIVQGHAISGMNKCSLENGLKITEYFLTLLLSL